MLCCVVNAIGKGCDVAVPRQHLLFFLIFFSFFFFFKFVQSIVQSIVQSVVQSPVQSPVQSKVQSSPAFQYAFAAAIDPSLVRVYVSLLNITVENLALRTE